MSRYRQPYRGAQARQRMLLLARNLYAGRTITTQWVQRMFGVSSRTACTDLAMLAMYLPCEQGHAPLVHYRGKPRKTVKLAKR